MEYRLKHTWSIYDHIKSDCDNYETNTRKIGDIDTIVGFWQFFNHYPKPSLLFNVGNGKPTLDRKEISSVSFFKQGIQPKWEDPVNQLGAELSKRRFIGKNPIIELESNWFDLLYACIGENVDSTVTGVRIVDSSSLRTGSNTEYKLLYRIELWFSDTAKKSTIEEFMKKTLKCNEFAYKEHTIKDKKI
jgi:hypothetical protein